MKPVAATGRMLGRPPLLPAASTSRTRTCAASCSGCRAGARRRCSSSRRTPGCCALNNVRLEPAAHLRHRRGDGRRRQPVPAVGDGQRRRASTASPTARRRWTGSGSWAASPGVGERSARIILLTDALEPGPGRLSGPRASGRSSPATTARRPPSTSSTSADELRPGDRVVTSGDGGLYPPDILIGQVAQGADGRQRVRLAADYRRLDFVRVVRSRRRPRRSRARAG